MGLFNEAIKGMDNIDKNAFELARKIYPGTKRGLDVEFTNFKKHKNWKTYLPLIRPAIGKQIEYRTAKRQLDQFVPEWKNFKTWINNNCWEEEYEEIKIVKSGGQSGVILGKEYWDKFRKSAAQAETERDKWEPGFLTSGLRNKK